jgi:hypothetical protein
MRKIKIPKRDGSPLINMLRTTGVVIVFFITALLFWKNYENTLEKITSRQTIYDQTKTLSNSQKKILKNFARYLIDIYGIEFKVNINKKHIKPPKNLSKTLYIGICPPKRRAIILFPVLLKKALPREFVEYMKTKYCKDYLSTDTWPIGLMNGIKLIYDQLNKLEDEDSSK